MSKPSLLKPMMPSTNSRNKMNRALAYLLIIIVALFLPTIPYLITHLG
jgi:uncharacterized membrane protein